MTTTSFFFRFPGALLLLALTISTGHAAEPDAAAQAEARLREALRTTTLQLRTAQNELATLQTVQAEKDKESTALKAQVAALAKQAAADRETAVKTAAGLAVQVEGKDGEIARLTAALEKWKNAANQTAELAKTTEAERARLSIQVNTLERIVADRESKNVALVKLGNEILIRFEKFGLGDAIGAKEPFIGLKRVQLETLVQGYADKILDQKYTPGAVPAAGPAPAAK